MNMSHMNTDPNLHTEKHSPESHIHIHVETTPNGSNNNSPYNSDSQNKSSPRRSLKNIEDLEDLPTPEDMV